MSNYVFTWPEGPQDVILTGEFDNWKGSIPLVKQANGSFKLIFPIESTHKFIFKFIVDGEWTVSDSYKKEADAGGIENNYLDTEDIVAANSNDTRIPESGGLSMENNSGTVTPTPTPSTTNRQQRAPPSTNNRKKGKKGKKMKLKKKIRRNKKTGERTVMSQEVEEIDTSETNTPAENEDGEEDDEEITPESSATPANDEQVHILPIDQNKETNQFQDTTTVTQSGPGPVLVSKPEEIPEFKQVREVDADELNERLNNELKQEEAEEEAEEEAKVEEPVAEEPVAEEPVAEEPVAEEPVAEEPVAEEPVAEEPVAEEPVAEEPVAEEPVAESKVAEPVNQTLDPKNAVEPVPAVAAEETKQTEKPKEKKKSTKTKETKKTIPVAAKNSEQQPQKKKGFFGKLKNLFK